jgi:hypothetical protein
MPDTNKYSLLLSRDSGCLAVYPPKPDRSALPKLLDEWMQGDEAEQRETFDVLRRSLDEDRPDGYKLFS